MSAAAHVTSRMRTLGNVQNEKKNCTHTHAHFENNTAWISVLRVIIHILSISCVPIIVTKTEAEAAVAATRGPQIKPNSRLFLNARAHC